LEFLNVLIVFLKRLTRIGWRSRRDLAEGVHRGVNGSLAFDDLFAELSDSRACFVSLLISCRGAAPGEQQRRASGSKGERDDSCPLDDFHGQWFPVWIRCCQPWVTMGAVDAA